MFIAELYEEFSNSHNTQTCTIHSKNWHCCQMMWHWGTLNILKGSWNKDNEWWFSNVTGLMLQSRENVSIPNRVETSGIHKSRPGYHDKWIMMELKEFKNINPKIVKHLKRWNTSWAHSVFFLSPTEHDSLLHQTARYHLCSFIHPLPKKITSAQQWKWNGYQC